MSLVALALIHFRVFQLLEYTMSIARGLLGAELLRLRSSRFSLAACLCVRLQMYRNFTQVFARNRINATENFSIFRASKFRKILPRKREFRAAWTRQLARETVPPVVVGSVDFELLRRASAVTAM